MPTNLGTPMHVGNAGDRTTPLPVTTWQPPVERPKFVWPVQDPVEPATQPPTPAPAKKASKLRKAATARQRIRPLCECGRPRSPQSRQCQHCYNLNRTTHTSVVDINTARTEYTAGATCPQIATKHGWPVVSVRRQLRAAGVTMRDDRSTHSGGRNKTEVTRPELPCLIRSLYLDQGMSQRQVAEWVGVTPKVVVHVMKREGIPARAGHSGGGDTLVGIRDRLNTLGVTSADVRYWARTRGLPVGVRGIVPTHLIDAYEKAHQ